MGSSRQNIIFIIVLILIVGLAAGGYMYFSRGSASGPLVVSDTAPQSEALAATRQGILDNIEAVKSIKLDTTILTDPAFLRLQKVIRPPVEDPGVGRPNPFLPYKAKAVPAAPAAR